MRFGAFEQQRLQALELRGVEQRLAAGASGLAQSGRALLAVLPPPLTDRLPRDLQPPRRLGLIQALPLDQPDRFETALLQRLEIPPYAFRIAHTVKTLGAPKRYRNIMRDSVRHIDHTRAISTVKYR